MNRRPLTALLLTLACLAPIAVPAAAVPPAPAPAAAATIPIDEIHAGQKGYGLSVFTGGQVERFDVEVLGVLRNLTPDTSYILARLTGHGLEQHGVIAGMSGSPVFLDGRLAGAVAFSWPFSNDAVGGITPIADMRRLNSLASPAAAPAASPALPPLALADLLSAKLPVGLLERELARLRPPVAAGGTSSIQWSAAGFGELSQGLLRQALGAVFSAGAANGGAGTALPGAAPTALAPGAAVGAVLIDGDLK
ncbi:MAG TPA: SpoIVB peptidase S55 domain-containing protein, partial [Thermoanaerobaculia bacterium]